MAVDAGRERILSVWQWQWGHLLGKVAVSKKRKISRRAKNNRICLKEAQQGFVSSFDTSRLPTILVKSAIKSDFPVVRCT